MGGETEIRMEIPTKVYSIQVHMYIYEYCNYTIYSTPFYKIMVPTVDTVRYDFLVHNLVLVGEPVLLVGPVGTGKTSVAQTVLQKLDATTFSVLTINLSAQVWINKLKLKFDHVLIICRHHQIMSRTLSRVKLRKEQKVVASNMVIDRCVFVW